MHVALVGGIPESLVLFRGPLVRDLIAAGHEVTTLAGHDEPWVTEGLARTGAAFATYPLDRAGTGALADLATIHGLTARFRTLRPDAVIAYTAKPVIWGAFAARRAGVPRFHALITGRGDQFEHTGVAGLRTRLLRGLYRHALAGVDDVVFQNAEDRDFFVDASCSRGCVS